MFKRSQDICPWGSEQTASPAKASVTLMGMHPMGAAPTHRRRGAAGRDLGRPGRDPSAGINASQMEKTNGTRRRSSNPACASADWSTSQLGVQPLLGLPACRWTGYRPDCGACTVFFGSHLAARMPGVARCNLPQALVVMTLARHTDAQQQILRSMTQRPFSSMEMRSMGIVYDVTIKL